MKIISIDTLKEERRHKTIEQKLPYTIGGEKNLKFVDNKIVNGEMEVLDFAKPVGEMITTPAGLDSIVQKTVVDLALGREALPLLYGPISNNNGSEFTQFVGRKAFCKCLLLEHAELGGN